jgi:DnaJ-class molecular chaperone
MSKIRHKELLEDTRWKFKGNAHPLARGEPSFCPKCKGTGTITKKNHIVDDICPLCGGEGVLW